MANELQVFKYHDKPVRTVEKNGETWFVAKDVCDVLGIGNITMALKSLDNDEKNSFTNSEGNQNRRGNPNMAIVNEPGLYKLIFKSRKTEAKNFTRWVTHEVLPAIRRHGMYLTELTVRYAQVGVVFVAIARALRGKAAHCLPPHIYPDAFRHRQEMYRL